MRVVRWIAWPALLAAAASLAGQTPAPTATLAGDAARVERDIRALAAFGTRHSLSETESETRGIGAARRWLQTELERISKDLYAGRLQVGSYPYEVGASKRIPNGATIVNVMGVLPGSDAKRLVVVSGHYDSMPSDVMDPKADAPGANDDASGSAAVLECARLCAGLQPRATVVFLLVAGEEQGLIGSTAQAQAWRDQGYEVEAFITNDIVGGGTGSNGRREADRVRLFSEGVPSAGAKIVGSDADAPSRELARFIAEHAGPRVPGFQVDLVFRQDRFLRGGDHRPFNLQGWAAVRMTEPNENYAHQHQNVRLENGVQYGDLPEFVDFAYVGRVAALNASAVQALALAPAPPSGVTLDTSKLSQNTHLTWNEARAGSVAGYRVRMRKTSEPSWTKSVDAGLVREITLENTSMDDWLFAVEAYDSAGHASIPVYPQPSR